MLRTPPGLPTATIAFVFSDIEGSTQRWEANHGAMTLALRRHDALLRTALEAHGGYVFKTIGDAFCAAFTRPEDALAAALDALRTLLAEDFCAVDGVRVRMALHAGTADERDGDYFGPALNRVARLLAIGHGGQVLVSAAAAELLQEALAPQNSLRDLGAHVLKDLARPERVYQLIAPDLPEIFPALRSVEALPNNLPRQLTSFLGREKVLADVAALLAQAPLVMLVGTGGAGKTRCAAQVGAELEGTGGDRSALPRQQTMRALIDWSYDLVCDRERALFRTLSIFAGGFTLESTCAVCADEHPDGLEVLDLLTSLLDKSLVHADSTGNATRYRLLESTRQYAREKLIACGEHAKIARAHLAAYTDLAERLDRAWETMPERAWLAQIEPELENWRAALEWALTARVLGRRLAGALRWAWSWLAAAEGRRWVRTALEAADEATPAPDLARLDVAEAQLDSVLMQFKASYAAAARALVHYRTLDDPLGTAEAQRQAGSALVSLGRNAEGEELLARALAATRNLGARKLTGLLLKNIASAHESR